MIAAGCFLYLLDSMVDLGYERNISWSVVEDLLPSLFAHSSLWPRRSPRTLLGPTRHQSSFSVAGQNETMETDETDETAFSKWLDYKRLQG